MEGINEVAINWFCSAT